MVVKNRIKFIKKLQQKKYRKESGLFVAEGPKLVLELLKGDLEAVELFASKPLPEELSSYGFQQVGSRELQLMSGMVNPNGILGVFKVLVPAPLDYSDWILALDDIQDPGNLGTIIRLCDWFGIGHILCSPATVDAYNPKVLQASMGSIGRVNLVYGDLHILLGKAKVPVYGTFMDGTPVTVETEFQPGILVMGNEGHGISGEIAGACSKRLSIPQYVKSTAESLNVATASGILLFAIRQGLPFIQK